MVKSATPALVAVSYGPEGALGGGMMYLSIKKRCRDDARVAALSAFRADPFANVVIVVDEDIDVYDEEEVLWAVGTRLGGKTEVITEASASEQSAAGGNSAVVKLLLDATVPLDDAFPKRVIPDYELWDSMNIDDYLR